MRKLSHQEIVRRQNEKRFNPRVPFCVVLNNIRSLHNVGSIFRTADGAGVEKIWICGITGHPPNSQIAKTALGAQDYVPWEYRAEVIPLIQELKGKNYQIVMLEQIEGSVPCQDFIPQVPVCLVIGSEIQGVSDQLVSYCDAALEIEMAGLKNSLNVAVAFGIAAYHFRETLQKQKGEKSAYY